MPCAQTSLKHSNTWWNRSFRDLSLEHISRIIDRMKYQTASAGDDIVVQGEKADELMVVIEGTCVISVNGQMVKKIYKLDLFGGALVSNDGSHVRGATVTAVTPVKLMALHRRDYEKLLRKGIISSSHHQRAVELMNKHKRRDTLRNLAVSQSSSKNGSRMVKVLPVSDAKAFEYSNTVIGTRPWLSLLER